MISSYKINMLSYLLPLKKNKAKIPFNFHPGSISPILPRGNNCHEFDVTDLLSIQDIHFLLSLFSLTYSYSRVIITTIKIQNILSPPKLFCGQTLPPRLIMPWQPLIDLSVLSVQFYLLQIVIQCIHIVCSLLGLAFHLT